MLGPVTPTDDTPHTEEVPHTKTADKHIKTHKAFFDFFGLPNHKKKNEDPPPHMDPLEESNPIVHLQLRLDAC